MQKKLLLTIALSTIFTFSATANEINYTPVPNKKSAAGKILNANHYHHLNFTDFGNKYTSFKDYIQKKYGEKMANELFFINASKMIGENNE